MARRRPGTPVPAHVPHGRDNTYSHYGCRCYACKRAHSEKILAWRRDKHILFALGLDVPKVHNASAYRTWGCRCDVCLTAVAEARARLPIDHEKYTATTNYDRGCRCTSCRRWKSQARKRNKQSRVDKAILDAIIREIGEEM